MIYGLVSEWREKKAYFPAVFDRVFAFLASNDIAALADGRYPLDGERIVGSFETLRTVDESQRRFEAHRKYLDIQVLLAGTEKHLYAPNLDGMTLTEDFPDKDLAFYTTPAWYSSLILSRGQYAVYFPGEAHCPVCAAAPGGHDIRKVVFKIRWPE